MSDARDSRDIAGEEFAWRNRQAVTDAIDRFIRELSDWKDAGGDLAGVAAALHWLLNVRIAEHDIEKHRTTVHPVGAPSAGENENGAALREHIEVLARYFSKEVSNPHSEYAKAALAFCALHPSESEGGQGEQDCPKGLGHSSGDRQGDQRSHGT